MSFEADMAAVDAAVANAVASGTYSNHSDACLAGLLREAVETPEHFSPGYAERMMLEAAKRLGGAK